MTYIRMTEGRDRGHVKEYPFVEAQEKLSLGQALPVNFDEPDPLGFRELQLPAASSQPPEKPELAAAPLGDVILEGPLTPPGPSAAATVAPNRTAGHSKPAGGFRRGSR
jgi:hypothetical protein